MRFSNWPLIGVGTCVLLLALLAPWAWRSPPPVERMLEAMGDCAVAEGPIAAATGDVGETVGLPVAAADHRWDLTQFTAPRRLVATMPPIAERIDFDPAVAREPDVSVPPPLVIPPLPEAEPRSEVRAGDSPVPEAAPAHLMGKAVLASPSVLLVWPTAESLTEVWSVLAADSGCASWAVEVQRALAGLASLPSLAAPEVGPLLEQLERLTTDGESLASHVVSPAVRCELQHATFALARRLSVWTHVHQIVTQVAATTAPRDVDAPALLEALDRIDRYLGNSTAGQAWKDYLRTAELRALGLDGRLATSAGSRLARQVLQRMESPSLTAEQRRVFSDPLFHQWATRLRGLVCEPVDYWRLLGDLERYELVPSSSTAQQLAASYQVLRWSETPQVVQLAENLNMHYRNGNVRVAISAALLNRLLPDPQTFVDDVRDQIGGARVVGRSHTSTRLRVTLLPDRLRWRLGLEAEGEVASQTESNRGIVTLYNEGRSQYQARKQLLVDRLGWKLGDTVAEADGTASLTGMETDLDPIPVFNLLTRAIVRQQYDSQASTVRGHLRERVADRVKERFDVEVQRHLDEAHRNVRTKLYEPVERLGLEPTPVDMRTTDERLILRYRLAGAEQLAAHTPRPQAPGDSLLSIQVHESAINNTLEQLGLNGAHDNLRTLLDQVATRLDRPPFTVPEEFPDDVFIRLAAHDAIRVTFDQDRVLVAIQVAELRHQGHIWRNFTVRAFYQPAVDGLKTSFVRDGYVLLKGERLKLRDQVALRGIFTKVLAKHPEAALLPTQLSDHVRLQDQQVNQLVLRDGWIGIAIGPRRRPEPLMAREPVAPARSR